MNDKETGPKLFYSTSEACSQAGVSPHSLRYWERRIGLNFYRSPKGKRLFRPEDIERLRHIAGLIREGYSLKAVPRRLREQSQMELPFESHATDHRKTLKRVRDELDGMLSLLNGNQRIREDNGQ